MEEGTREVRALSIVTVVLIVLAYTFLAYGLTRRLIRPPRV